MRDMIVDSQPRDATGSSSWDQRLKALSLQPLWDSKLSLHTDAGVPDDGHIWHWRDMRQVMQDAGEMSSPAVIQRRVVEMIDPRRHYADGEGTIGTINACFQLLKPGERARPHRHSMNAIRFVVESSGGAKTIVDGKHIPMLQGDLVLTPGWCWHEHVHEGDAPVIWLDVLDLALHRFLRTEAFEPGPVANPNHQFADNAFAASNIAPVLDDWRQDYSPVFRYPWADALKALHNAPEGDDGSRTVRYLNPADGGAALPFMDMLLLHVPPGGSHRIAPTLSDMVLCPVQGAGVAEIGDNAREYAVNDVISVPLGRPLRLAATGDGTIFFVVTNAPLLRKLKLQR